MADGKSHIEKWTYHELHARVVELATAMRGWGVKKGDRVLLYMPMVPEALMAMLACARIGAMHSVVFGGFAAHELAKRIQDAQPSLSMKRLPFLGECLLQLIFSLLLVCCEHPKSSLRLVVSSRIA